MFSFFRKKKPAPPPPETPVMDAAEDAPSSEPTPSGLDEPAQAPAELAVSASPSEIKPEPLTDAPPEAPAATADAPAPPPVAEAAPEPSPEPQPDDAPSEAPSTVSNEGRDKPAPRQSWLSRLRQGLSKTGANISAVFVNAKIDDDLYDELEAALLSADVGVKATTHLLERLRRDVRAERAQTPEQVKALLRQGVAQLLQPLERQLVIGEHPTTVLMVAGVNGAGKTTSIGKLTQHLSQHKASVLLAAADTFRAAAREQLSVWADRNAVEIVSQANADPAAVSYDAVRAGISRQRDVVIIDTAGRLPTQLHLMDELRKIKRVVTKAEASAPHEVLLVLDGNTGQNALAQVKAFDEALQLTGLIVTKLDGTAKGGVLAAIAMERPVPVYFIGVGEQLQDLQTFSAEEFAQALLP